MRAGAPLVPLLSAPLLLAPVALALWPVAAAAGPGLPPALPPGPVAPLASEEIAQPGWAEADRIFDLMGLPRLVQTMRIEGLAMSAQLAEDYLAPAAAPAFHDMAARIYDTPRMERVMRRAFARHLCQAAPWQLEHLLAFYDSPAAQRIVTAELAARRAFLDAEVEEAAARAAEIARVQNPTLSEAVDRYVAAADLVEMNLGGMLTANYHFYLGLVDGGAFVLSEDEMLADVWQQEDSARLEIELWLRAFLTRAYRDLPEAELADYLTLIQSAEGQRLNAALFEAYGVLYNDLYHALGRGVSTLLSGEDL
ncbi:DUF2059 domain-containing protein [Pseudooceanicola sp. 200-1SW]|uniref:DUF2059 domain-containing protein n=1 Tax=Pseudooceanicola sp. 200-1SW TaxID=3425949 RepID=UPI003D7F2997